MWKNPTDSQGFRTSQGGCFGPPNGDGLGFFYQRDRCGVDIWTLKENSNWTRMNCRLGWEKKRWSKFSNFHWRCCINSIHNSSKCHIYRTKCNLIVGLLNDLQQKTTTTRWFSLNLTIPKPSTKKNKNDHRVTATPKKIISEPARPTSSSPGVESWSHCNQPPFLLRGETSRWQQL